ncbi:hypothetical protein SLINC_0122 [Streptomyces lincolnensis]|uniref:Uncharacterized protein n=1 Tax=Streptomyces lincolnensis TaxID=1915 RepID=A0A1B1M159_STRLN|nr:hypothetical protein SLINC_0122 [Streptomyces lincolnensis]AXG51274.1 hypothetical protein SLCG_0119 [Streptomyces lincolnensis]
MERRTFLTISGTALSALAADWAGGPASALAQARDGKPIGEELVAFLEDSTRHLAGLPTEQRQHTPALLDAHLAAVTDLLETGRYTPALGLRLHTLAASLSQTVAWHAFDLRRHTHASQSWIAGLHNAHAAGDRDMGAGLLGDLAYQAAWRRDHTTAANILHHALTRAQNPAARCLLQLRLARTLAARGDRSERGAVLRALAAAEHHLDDAGTDRPAWCAWVSEADLAVDSGQALLDLGDTSRAHHLISEGERLLPPDRDKTKGVFLAYRAASYLDLKEPEPAAAAAAAATQSLLLPRRIGAPRCARLIDDLLPRFEPYARTQGVRELFQLAAAQPEIRSGSYGHRVRKPKRIPTSAPARRNGPNGMAVLRPARRARMRAMPYSAPSRYDARPARPDRTRDQRRAAEPPRARRPLLPAPPSHGVPAVPRRTRPAPPPVAAARRVTPDLKIPNSAAQCSCRPWTTVPPAQFPAREPTCNGRPWGWPMVATPGSRRPPRRRPGRRCRPRSLNSDSREQVTRR